MKLAENFLGCPQPPGPQGGASPNRTPLDMQSCQTHAFCAKHTENLQRLRESSEPVDEVDRTCWQMESILHLTIFPRQNIIRSRIHCTILLHTCHARVTARLVGAVLFAFCGSPNLSKSLPTSRGVGKLPCPGGGGIAKFWGREYGRICYANFISLSPFQISSLLGLPRTAARWISVSVTPKRAECLHLHLHLSSWVSELQVSLQNSAQIRSTISYAVKLSPCKLRQGPSYSSLYVQHSSCEPNEGLGHCTVLKRLQG